MNRPAPRRPRHPASGGLRRALLAGCLLSATPAALSATVADDLCPADADPCLVTTAIIATPNSVIDVGQRELQISGNDGSISVQSGGLTLRGRRIVTGAAAILRTSGPTRALPAAPLDIVADEILLSGPIDVRGSPAGAVRITATGALTMSGPLRGRSEAADTSASTVTLRGGFIVLSGSIELDGGRDDSGGDLVVSGDRVTISDALVVDGGDGGTVDLSATEVMVLTAASSVSAEATTAGGDGGDITIDSDGFLELRGTLSANGRSGDEGGGDGGQISLNGDFATSLPDAATVVQTLGGSPDGLAGDIEVGSLNGAVEIGATLAANSEERDGVGGTVDVSAGTGVTIAGKLQARGALGGAGDIEIDSDGAVTIAASGEIDASAAREAAAGSVLIAAGSAISIRGSILADTTRDDAGGGSVTLRACSVAVESGASVHSRGLRSVNSITAAGAISIRGSMTAGPQQGVNELRFPEEGPLPITTGSSIVPAPVLVPDPAVIPCVPLPPTATPTVTRTPVPSATPSPSATADPFACPGDCDGNQSVSIAELVRAVNIALDRNDIDSCRAVDTNDDGRVAINELVRAVSSALNGCGG